MLVVKKVGEYKKLHNIAPLDEERWKKILQFRLSKIQSSSIVSYILKNYIIVFMNILLQYSMQVVKNYNLYIYYITRNSIYLDERKARFYGNRRLCMY